MITIPEKGIYGEDLPFFSEQFVTLQYCKKEALVGAGFTENEDVVDFFGIIQFIRQTSLSRENEVLAKVDVPTLFTESEIPIGFFVLDGEELYRVDKLNNWDHYNTVRQYILETVRSVTNQETDSTVQNTSGYL